jgi:Protein of unknown function (DUF5818)
VKKFLSLSFLATLAIVLGMISSGSALAQSTPSSSPDRQAQQPSSSPDTTPSQQTPSTQTPDTTPNTQSSQPPATGSQSSQTPDTTTPQSGATPGTSSNGSAAAGANENAGGTQTFSGTVVKQGDKYVLKDDAGKTYDIDHQSDVAKFEGKRVRVQGTLDSNGKIMVK